jgi:hypothetical protein
VPITKIHLLAIATTGRRFSQILSARPFRYLSKTLANIFKIIYFTKWKGFFSSRLVTMSSSASHHGKANNYLNIKGENLDNYFWIALVVS